MIFTVFFYLLSLFLNVIISILPEGGAFPSEIASGMAIVWGTFKAWDFILPTNAIIQTLTIGFTFWIFVFVWRLVHWALRKIPMINVS